MASSKEKMKSSLKKIKNKIKKAPLKIQSEISERLGTKFSHQLDSVLNSRLSEQAQAAVKTAVDNVQAAQVKAQSTLNLAVSVATETAKHSLDEVLLNLEHRGVKVKESQDLAVKVGRLVLERAEKIRAQIAANPLSPNWIKDVSLTPNCSNVADAVANENDMNAAAAAASSFAEATVSTAAQGMSEPEHADRAAAEPVKVKKSSRGARKSSTNGASESADDLK